MDRREFAISIGGIGGIVVNWLAPVAEVRQEECSLSKLNRLLKASGGSVFSDHSWDICKQRHLVLLEVILGGVCYSVADEVNRVELLDGDPGKLINAKLEVSASVLLDYLTSRGLI